MLRAAALLVATIIAALAAGCGGGPAGETGPAGASCRWASRSTTRSSPSA